MRGAIRSRRAFDSLLFALTLLAALHPAAVFAHELSGRVVGVSDGDTLTVLVGEERIRVRLADIDAPESGQPYGLRARSSLAGLCSETTARVETAGRDRYGRVLGRVSCGGVRANSEQVRRGYAWVYDRYAPRDSPLYELQREAREHRRGLWDGADPLPPWQWRQLRYRVRGRAA